jgi:hypothetical protein
VTDVPSGPLETGAPADGAPVSPEMEAANEIRGRYKRPLRDRISHGDSYVLVFAFISIAYLCNSLLPFSGWSGFLVVVVNSLTLLTALRTSWTSRRVQRIAQVMCGIMVVASGAAALFADVHLARGITLPLTFALLVLTEISILRRIARHEVITYETLAGAVDVYLLIGLLFSAFYGMLQVYSGQPFFVQVADASPNQYLYFSYVTLATLGYGDLTPATNMGRTVVVFEAILGQVYLVTMVARLVSLLGSTRKHA